MNDNELEIKQHLEQLAVINGTDPVQFEQLREQLIEKTISSFPERYQKRARGMQFVIDSELNKNKNPVNRMNRMIELFWDKFYEFNAVMNDPAGYAVEREENRKKGK